MSQYISLPRAGLVALVTAFALAPASALGDQPVVVHQHVNQSFSTPLCGGIQVDATVVMTGNTFLYADGSSKITTSNRVTYTNPENGKSVIVSSAGQRSGSAIVDEAAGTITIVSSLVGLPEKIQTANGPVLLRDAGLFTEKLTFDLATFDLISDEIIINGPHPEAESDFTLFCEVITAALT
jgi:hypothetical protein